MFPLKRSIKISHKHFDFWLICNIFPFLANNSVLANTLVDVSVTYSLPVYLHLTFGFSLSIYKVANVFA